jgi:3-hydroxyisobutyrate dehydrogenase-like beta-hydroxyacid dehydrogenase
VGLIFTGQRIEGRQGISLAALAGLVEEALQAATRYGIDPDTVEPVVRGTTLGKNPKIKKLEIPVL